MKQILTPGRWRGLKTTSTDAHIFNILAIDQRNSYRKMLPENAPYEMAAQIKTEVVTILADHSSAVLLDPEFGQQAALELSGNGGLMMALEKSGYRGEATHRQIDFIEGWTVSKIKAMGAAGVKFLVHYNSESVALAEQIEGVVATMIKACHQLELPIFLEPLAYSTDAAVARDSEAFAKKLPGIVCETARRLSKLEPDILKMEFPVNVAFNSDRKAWRAACDALNAACEVPWVLLSAEVDFATFADQVRCACEAGASGFLAGRTIWKEAVPMDTQGRQRFLVETAIPRIDKLSEIAAKAARPWTDFYDPPQIKADWYKTYNPGA